MEKSQIHLSDWHRILFGDTPPIFLVEVLVRSTVTYVLLLVTVRLLGKRMNGQLTVTELAVMLTLGAIASLPMQMPDRGILLGAWVLILALIFQRGLTMMDWRSPRFETLTQGTVTLIARDGVLDLHASKVARLSREQIFAILRQRGVFNLGRVKRLYFEACGEFSLYLAPEEKLGLSTLPPQDYQARSDQPRPDHSVQICPECGENLEGNQPQLVCPQCGSRTGDQAVRELQASS